MQPNHANLILFNRLQLQASVTKAHSASTCYKPRSKNRRNPIASLTIPNTGSTVCLRKRQRARLSSVAIFARMRLSQSALGYLIGFSGTDGRKSCTRRVSSVPPATRTSKPRFSSAATSDPVA